MKTILINGAENIGKTIFSVKLAQRLAQSNKVLLISLRRQKNNIEDYLDIDDMITYDITDYFLKYAKLDKVITSVCDLDIILSPFVEDKYKIEKEDIDKLLDKIEYDYLIVDDGDSNLFSDYISILITDSGYDKEINEDYFFVNKVDSSFDDRYYDFIINNKDKYLGYESLKNDYDFKIIIDNLLNEDTKKVDKLSIFEKIKKKFRK
ncbi:MAG: hypothetical protein Q4B36_01340 [Tissierellia bacterium]|nr:hypothetical protein [Tissierellia bacterium]